jgi:hypothetical protein
MHDLKKNLFHKDLIFGKGKFLLEKILTVYLVLLHIGNIKIDHFGL